MKLKEDERVDIETAERRALSALHIGNPVFANEVADVIWPRHGMKSQGAGAAASRVLKRLQKKGLARWVSLGHTWGWIRL